MKVRFRKFVQNSIIVTIVVHIKIHEYIKTQNNMFTQNVNQYSDLSR